MNKSEVILINDNVFDNENNSIFDKLIWISTVILISSFVILDTNQWISMILLGTTGLIFALILIKQNGVFILKIESYQKYVFAFALFCILSSIWAWNGSLALSKGITIIEILICMSVLYIYYRPLNSVWRLINAVKWAGYITTIYAFAFYGLSTIMSVLSAGGRLDNDFANINGIAMFSVMAVLITFFQVLYNRFTFSLILVIPSIILVAASGSRKALVMTIIGIFLIALQRYSSKYFWKQILKWIVICTSIVFLVFLFSKLSIFSGINERMEGLFALITGRGVVDSSAMKRNEYMNIGFQQFLKTPLLGIGIGNSGLLLLKEVGYATYLHNNYAELLATGGIIGTLFFYVIYGYNLKYLWKYRMQNDPMRVICLVLIIVLLVLEWGMVSYYSKLTYLYFMIFFLEVEKLKEQGNAVEKNT